MCSMDVWYVKLNTVYERVERLGKVVVVVKWEGEPSTNYVYEMEVYCVGGEGKVKGFPGVFGIVGMGKNVMNPCWDVCCVINLEQVLSLE